MAVVNDKQDETILHKDTMATKVNRALVPAVLIGTILFVVGNAWLALRSVKALQHSQSWVDHTWQVISQVERVMSSAKDAETGSRGYLLTGDDKYLEPYVTAQKELPIEVDNFQRLTSDNPGQRARAQEMRAVLEQRLSLLSQGNEMRAGGADIGTLRAMVLTGTGKAEMDHLRRIADAMEAEERSLLAERVREAEAAAKRARYTLAMASGLDILLIVFMFRYFSRERDLRLSAEVAAEGLAVSRLEVERKATEILALNEGLELRVKERTAELEATNRELEAFSYSVSHDLRAPLRTIDGFSLALEEDFGDVVGAEGKDYIKRVRTGVQRMGGLIDALLQLSRITRAEIEREDVDVTTLAENVAAQVVDANPEQRIEFSIQKGLHANADPKLLRVALENLFGNAAKFSSKKPESKIEFGWDAEQKAWFVRDNGAGFDMHYKDKLFGAFNRLHGDKDFKGSGIGLATVARVVRRHHGRIWADSVVESGATFWFTLG
jgi:signal transduction histidine kinase